MSMTKEGLLRERYIVLNDYPNNYLLEVGQVLIANAKGNFCVADDEGFITIYPEKYPAIFRRLSWWEHRKESDMPEYVNLIEDYMDIKSGIYKFENWNDHFQLGEMPFRVNDSDSGLVACPLKRAKFEPADKSDYDSFQNKK